MSAWVDAALLALIVAFVWSKALLLGRGGNLGRSMAAFNVVIGAVYAYALARHAWPGIDPDGRLLPAMRVAVAATALWGLWELWRLRAGGFWFRRLRRRG